MTSSVADTRAAESAERWREAPGAVPFPPTPPQLPTLCPHLAQMSVKAKAAYNPDAITKKVFFDLTMGGAPAGRIVIGLYANDVPK